MINDRIFLLNLVGYTLYTTALIVVIMALQRLAYLSIKLITRLHKNSNIKVIRHGMVVVQGFCITKRIANLTGGLHEEDNDEDWMFVFVELCVCSEYS